MLVWPGFFLFNSRVVVGGVNAMEGIGTILGVIALAVALAALWFVNDVVKRIERQSQQLLETHVRAIKEAVTACESKVRGVEKDAAESDRKIADLVKKDAEVRQSLSESRAVVEQVRADLAALDALIPASFRNARTGRRSE